MEWAKGLKDRVERTATTVTAAATTAFTPPDDEEPSTASIREAASGSSHTAESEGAAPSSSSAQGAALIPACVPLSLSLPMEDLGCGCRISYVNFPKNVAEPLSHIVCMRNNCAVDRSVPRVPKQLSAYKRGVSEGCFMASTLFAPDVMTAVFCFILCLLPVGCAALPPACVLTGRGVGLTPQAYVVMPTWYVERYTRLFSLRRAFRCVGYPRSICGRLR